MDGKTEIVLETLRLQKENDVLRWEIEYLKKTITDVIHHEMATQVLPKARSVASIKKMELYHKHKDEVLNALSEELGVPKDTISWQAVKTITNQKYR